MSEFGDASLPGLSENSEGKRTRSETDEKKKIRETLKHYATRESEFDTDPEVEQLNKPDHAVPIPIIRQQRDFERESEQSPHNAVVEPVPMKASKSSGDVPQIGKIFQINSIFPLPPYGKYVQKGLFQLESEY